MTDDDHIEVADTGQRRRHGDSDGVETARLARLDAIEEATNELRETVGELSTALVHAAAAALTARQHAESAEETSATIARTVPSRRRLWIIVMALLATIYASGIASDEHINHCLVHGPRTRAAQRVCNTIFFTHDHKYSESIEGILTERVEASHAACIQSNRRTETEASIFDDLALTVPPEAGVIITRLRASAARLRSLITNCDALFPAGG